MHSTRKILARCGLWALLAVSLAAGSAEAAHRKKPQDSPARCMQHCNEDNQDKLRVCMQSCPKPRRGKMEAFQACSQHCSANLNTDACYERCEQGNGKRHGR